MTDFGRRAGGGDMLKSVYDPNKDGVIAVAQTQADMTKAVYDPALAALAATLGDHSADHESAGDDEIDVTGLAGTTPTSLLADATPGRTLRQLLLFIRAGTDPNTIKVKTTDRFNHTVIAEVDNIGKDATTGGFHLNAAGTYLVIGAALLEGNVQMAQASRHMAITLDTDAYPKCEAYNNGIRVGVNNPATDDLLDWTNFCGSGEYRFCLLYITA